MQKTLISQKDMLFYNRDTVLMCLALGIVGICLNGITAVYQLAVSVATAIICEALSFRLLLKKKTLSDLGALSTGLVTALLLPASAPLYVAATASAFSVLIAKLPFGDGRNAPFLPSAAGFCFAAMLFPKEVFTYPAVTQAASGIFFGQEGFIKGTTLLEMLKTGNSLPFNIFGISGLLSGRIPGAMGTVSILCLTGVACYLLVRAPKRLICSFGFLISAGLFAFAFPRINSGRLSSVVMELSASSLIFVALIMINNPVNCPQKPFKAFLYGALGGVVAMLLRYFSAIGDPTVFTVLIMNALWVCNFRTVKKEGELNG